jgi:RNA-binding protein
MKKENSKSLNTIKAELATFQIGKKGLTKELLKEIDLQLEKKGVIKGKILKTALINQEKKELIAKLKTKLKLNRVNIIGSTLILIRGKTKVLKTDKKKNV